MKAEKSPLVPTITHVSATSYISGRLFNDTAKQDDSF